MKKSIPLLKAGASILPDSTFGELYDSSGFRRSFRADSTSVLVFSFSGIYRKALIQSPEGK